MYEEILLHLLECELLTVLLVIVLPPLCRSPLFEQACSVKPAVLCTVFQFFPVVTSRFFFLLDSGGLFPMNILPAINLYCNVASLVGAARSLALFRPVLPPLAAKVPPLKASCCCL